MNADKNGNILSWNQRLQIAVDVAEGEYESFWPLVP